MSQDFQVSGNFNRSFSLQNSFAVGNPVLGTNFGRTRSTVTLTATSFSVDIFAEGRDFLPGSNDGFGVGAARVLINFFTVEQITPYRLTGLPTIETLPGVPFGSGIGLSSRMFVYDRQTGLTLNAIDNIPTEGFLSPEYLVGIEFFVRAGVRTEGYGYSGQTWNTRFELIPAPGTAGLLALAGVLAARRRRR